MKKLFVLGFLLATLNVFSQDLQKEIDDIKKAETENAAKAQKIRDQITELNSQVNTNYIDSTQTIIYDFKTKKYKKSNVLPKVGEPLVFKIININRLAYEIEIKSEDVAISDEYFNPKEEQVIADSQKNTIPKDEIAKQSIQIPVFDATSMKDSGNPLNNNIAQLNKLMSDLTLAQDELFAKAAQFSMNENEVKSLNSKKSEYESQLLLKPGDELITVKRDGVIGEISTIEKSNEDLKITIKNLERKVTEVKTELSTLSQIFFNFKLKYDALMKSYSSIVSNGNDIIKIENNYREFRSIVLNPLLDQKQYEKSKSDPNFILKTLEESKQKVLSFEGQINDFYNQYNIAINDWEFFDNLNPDARENVRSRYQLIKGEVDKIAKSINTETMKVMLLKVTAIDMIMLQDKAYETVSSPIQPLEDYVTFNVKIKYRDSNKNSEYDDNREFVYMEYTQGGVRFDFSTGVVFNFGNDDKYEIADSNIVVDGVTQKEILRTDNNHFTPSIAGMFHTSFRRSGIWAVGLTLGASINVETFELNSLFPGISLLIGKKQKFIFTAGPSFRKVDTLKDQYEVGENYAPGDFTEETQLTSSQFRIGAFFGITYNLTQKQRAKFKIGSN
jgi:chaperonin cofactor prefoldin